MFYYILVDKYKNVKVHKFIHFYVIASERYTHPSCYFTFTNENDGTLQFAK